MFEAYAIGVTLKLNNLISPQLQLVAGELSRLDGLVASLNLGLKRLGGESAGLKAIAASGNATTAAMERASRSTANLERQLIGLKAAGTMPVMPVLSPPGGGGRGGGGGGGHGGGGYGRLPGGHGGNLHMGPGGVGISGIGVGMGSAGFVPMAVTAGMLYGGHALYESAKDLNTEMSRFKLFGLGDKLNNEAFQFVAGMKVYGSSQAENMKHFREAQGVFRESGLNDSSALEGAKLAAPMLAKIEFATASLDAEAQARIRTSSRAMLRYIEMSGGLQDADKFNKLANFGFKMVTTSGGTVDWEQLRQFKAISGISSRLMTDEAMAMAEPLIGELKGSGAGTGLRTAFNRLNGIVKIPNQVAHALVDQGMWDPSKIEFNGAGGIKTFKGNPFTGSKDFQENPWLWYQKNVMPMYERMKLDDAGRNQYDAMLFGGTGGRLFSQVRGQLPTMMKSATGLNKALNINQAGNVANQSLSGQEVEFGKAWTDFKTQFGNTMLPTFSTMLRDGAAVLRGIGDFMRENAKTMETVRHMIGFLTPVFNPASRAMGAVSDVWYGAKSFLNPRKEPVSPIATGKAPMSSLSGLTPAALNSSAAGLTTIALPSAGQTVQVNSTVNLDGRKVAESVTRHQSKAIARPPVGMNSFDGSMHLSPVGAS